MRETERAFFLVTVVTAILVSLGLFVLLVRHAHAQSPDPAPHERFHQYYQTWKQPGMYGLSCCNANEYVDTISGRMHIAGDCEPTRFEIRNGHWWAKVPDYMIEAGVQPWVEIPEDKILHANAILPMRRGTSAGPSSIGRASRPRSAFSVQSHRILEARCPYSPMMNG